MKGQRFLPFGASWWGMLAFPENTSCLSCALPAAYPPVQFLLTRHAQQRSKTNGCIFTFTIIDLNVYGHTPKIPAAAAAFWRGNLPGLQSVSEHAVGNADLEYLPKQGAILLAAKNGVDVIPNVRWGDERTFAFCFDGIPMESTEPSAQMDAFRRNPTDSILNKGCRLW